MRRLAASLSLLLWAAGPVLRGASMHDYAVAAARSDAQEQEPNARAGAFPCTVFTYTPELGFDFRFHARYAAIVRRKDLLKDRDELNVTLRVSPADRPEASVNILQQFKVRDLTDSSRGEMILQGTFLLGIGQYTVDWLLRDGDERVCARFWSVQTRMKRADSMLELVVPKDLIEPLEPTLLLGQFPVDQRRPGPPFHVKIIINFAPEDPKRATLDQHEVEILASILRAVLREPGITAFSVIAGSLRTQQILYVSRKTAAVDLTAIGDALARIKLGVVDAKALSTGTGESGFLKVFLNTEISDGDYDALIFVGPKYPLRLNIDPDAFAGRIRPIVYLHHESDPLLYPWHDAIGRIVKRLHGREYAINQPRDLLSAWVDVVSRICP